MKDYKDAINSFYVNYRELRKNLVIEIREFVKKYGAVEGDKRVLRFDGMIDSFISMPMALFLTDRRMDSYGWENIESITYKSDDEPLVFDCEYGDTDSDYMIIGDLTDLYESLLDIQELLDKGELVVEDGEITLPE